jgi:hypothetical protein
MHNYRNDIKRFITENSEPVRRLAAVDRACGAAANATAKVRRMHPSRNYQVRHQGIQCGGRVENFR